MERDSLHQLNGASHPQLREVTEAAEPATGAPVQRKPSRKVSAEERHLRERIGHALKHACAVTRGGAETIAGRWGVHPSLVRQICNPEHEKFGSVSLSRVLLLPKSALQVFLALGDDVFESGTQAHIPVEKHVLRLMEKMGRVAADVNDKEKLRRDAIELIEEGQQTLRDLGRD